ncbi:MAG: hypothetical protein Q9175_006096 [Cornicularia normoerica]
MVRLEDKSMLERDARDEMENPLPQKKYDDRTIYLSRNNYGQPATVTGIVSITDFGHSVQGDDSNNGCIQAEVYRAPEVILEAGWTYSADIWNLGVMLWDSLENKTLFEAVDPLKSDYDDQTHLAHITALLGPPPQDFLALGKRTSMFYGPEGESLFRDRREFYLTFIHTRDRQIKGHRPHSTNFQPWELYQQNRWSRQEDVPGIRE